MVFHDWTLDRLTAKDGAVRDKSADELAQVPLNSGGNIPRLTELLRLVGGRVPILVEIKSKRSMPWKPLCRSVAAALSTYRGAAAVMSFDPRVVRWFSRTLPGRPRGLVTGRGEGRQLAFGIERAVSIAHSRPTFIACDIRDLPDPALARYRGAGVPLLTWTVRSRELMARARLHADAPIAEGAGLS